MCFLVHRVYMSSWLGGWSAVCVSGSVLLVSSFNDALYVHLIVTCQSDSTLLVTCTKVLGRWASYRVNIDMYCTPLRHKSISNRRVPGHILHTGATAHLWRATVHPRAKVHLTQQILHHTLGSRYTLLITLHPG